jgi:hypothetical protein
LIAAAVLCILLLGLASHVGALPVSAGPSEGASLALTSVISDTYTVVTGTLPSGNVYVVEYKVTAGDILVGVVAFVFLVVAIVVRKL